MKTLNRLEYYRCRYADRKPGWEPATARYQRWVAGLLTPETRVLDLGCGRGGIAERLHAQGTWVGVDPDLASLFGHRVPGMPRSQGPAVALPFAAAAFDLVVSSWVLEHVPDPVAIFAEVARVLRPGGRFVFLTPNARHPIPQASRWLARMLRVQRQIVTRVYGRAPGDTFPVHYRANTPEAIDQAACPAGLRLVRMALIDDPAYWAWNAPTFELALHLEALLPAMAKVHLIGDYIRQGGTQ